MASNDGHATLNEASEASVARSRTARPCATATPASLRRHGGERGAKGASRDPKKEPTPPNTVSLRDGDGAVADEGNAVVVQDARDMTASSADESEDGEQKDSTQDSQDSRETNREPLEERKDADASNVLGRSPANTGDPRRDHSEEGVAGPSPSSMEHDSGVAAVQAAGQLFPHSRALLESPVEGLERRVDEQTGRRALASQSVGRRESDKKEPQLRRPSERPPQMVRQTIGYEILLMLY
nr:uncharacterized protein LOC126518273 [Dermacentor andersoni]